MKTIFRYFFIFSFVVTVFAGLIFCSEYEQADTPSLAFTSGTEIFRAAVDEITINTSNDFATKEKLNYYSLNFKTQNIYLSAAYITFYDSFFIPSFVSKRIIPLARDSLVP
ncbi:MAG: hypothetical protein NT145_02135 [Elusimicrobia bacterium]|nr:hypothetical protein [Elusimicrobiota bacterium]